MGAVLGTLGELGYGWAYRVLDAQYFGVAQRRRRVFIVGCLGDSARAAQVLFEPESLPGDSAPRREAGARVTQSLTGGPSSSSCGNPDDNRAQGGFVVPVCGHDTGQGWWNQSDIAGTLRAEGENRPSRPSNIVTHALTAEGHDASEDGTGRGTPLTVATLVSNGDSNSGFRDGEGCIAFSAGNSADAYGIALTEEGTPPLKAAESGLNQVPTVQYGMAVRRLTPTECERLQGFPDGWTDRQSDSARYRQLGNAVCVNVAEWIGRRIMEVTG
jgi:DNA (cytosine-5)-methyltransferase 1